jgi:transposase
MRYFIGVDLHRKFMVVCVMDESGRVVRTDRLYLEDVDGVLEYFAAMPAGSEVVMEATMSWMWLTDLLGDLGLKAHLANPRAVRLIAESRCKTDKIDARILADLLRTNYLPEAYSAPLEVRDRRMLLRHRQFLVKCRTAAKNSVHAILVRYNVHLEATDIFGGKGMEMLKALDLLEPARWIVDSLLECIGFQNERIKKVEGELRRCLEPDERVEWLMSLPGVGELSAYFVVAEIGTIERFIRPAKLVSYCGLCPSTRQSAEKVWHGGTGGSGRSLLKWCLVEAAHTAARRDSYFAHVFHQAARRKGNSKAYVAVAHAMAQIIWHMLKEGRPYRPRIKGTQVGSSAPVTVHA